LSEPAEIYAMRAAKLISAILCGAAAIHTRTPSPPHVTYFALTGGGDAIMAEFALSAFSLCRADPSVHILLVTNLDKMAERAADMLRKQCWGDGAPSRLSVSLVGLDGLRSRFREIGFQRFGHHSGLGGYAKLLAADLIPDHVERTVVVDTDTVFNTDAKKLWGKFEAFAPDQVLAAKPMTVTPENSDQFRCFTPGERFNSGVMLMDLKAMRARGWTRFVLNETAAVRHSGGKCASCVGKTSPTLICGDQEFLSFACKQQPVACGTLEREFHCDHCNDHAHGWHDDSKDFAIYHFNCGAKYGKMHETGGSERSKKLVKEFLLRVNPFKGDAYPVNGGQPQPWGSKHLR